MGDIMEFNLQDYLRDMDERLCQKVDQVGSKVDKLDAKIDNHETRLVLVENTRKTMRWLAATTIVGLITAGLDFLFSHLPKLIKHP